MRVLTLSIALLAPVLVGTLSTSAQAALRIYISATGSDSNDCASAATACRSLQHAHDTVAAKGEIDVLTAGDYGSVNITKSVSILGNGLASVPGAAGGFAITIKAGDADSVNLSGLHIEGFGAGASGIAVFTVKSLTVQNCEVRNFTASGIGISVTTNEATIAISNTVVSENGADGIFLQPGGSNVGAVRTMFNRVEAYHNKRRGIAIYGNFMGAEGFNQTIGFVVDSISSYNSVGFYALGGSVQGNTKLIVHRSAGFGNFNNTIRAENNSTIEVSETNISDIVIPQWSQDSSGSCIKSYGDNYAGEFPPPCGTLHKN
jgi:hypothetical protein